MTKIFDGRDFADQIEIEIRDRVEKLSKKPKLVTIYDPEDKSSRVYTNIKEKKAGEMGIDFQKFSILNFQFLVKEIKDLIIKLNNDEGVDGIMVQIPLVDRDRDRELCNLILPEKDVDGLGDDSPFVPATVRAVMAIWEEAFKVLNTKFEDPKKIVIIGNQGEVGSRLEKVLNLSFNKYHLTVEGMGRSSFDVEKIRQADVIISCTGQPGLIKPEMISEGVICIDVGYPEADFDSAVAKKAAFFTPVPGGVGPVTVAMLYANLVKLGNGWTKQYS